MDESIVEHFSDSKRLLTHWGDFKFDDHTQSVNLHFAFSPVTIIGKFFLETGLDWPKPYYEMNEDLVPEFKQPVKGFAIHFLKNYSKSVPTIQLGRLGQANIPEAIIKLLNNFVPTDHIKQVAPLIVQAHRTSPDSKFQFFKQEAFLVEIAHQLAPDLSKPDAESKLNHEITKSQTFQKNMLAKRPFSYKGDDINFHQHTGTQVNITTYPSFINWLFQFECGKPATFDNGYVIFRKSEHIVSFNKGPGTPGIEITNKGSNCVVCNNLTADNQHSAGDLFKTRKNQLISTLAHLYNLGYSQAVPMSDTAPAAGSENEEIYLIM